LRAGLHDAIAGLDLVKQEIAVGMDDFVAQSFGDGEHAAIDDRSGAAVTMVPMWQVLPPTLLVPSLIGMVGFTKLLFASRCPARSSMNWLAPLLMGVLMTIGASPGVKRGSQTVLGS
jgi:hypothetical protein